MRKTRQVLWLIEGSCQTINNRMRYAKELGQYIGIDIIGQCHQDGKINQVLPTDTMIENNCNNLLLIDKNSFTPHSIT